MSTSVITMFIFLFDMFMCICLLSSYILKQVKYYRQFGEMLPIFKIENLTLCDKQLLLVIALVLFNVLLVIFCLSS